MHQQQQDRYYLHLPSCTLPAQVYQGDKVLPVPAPGCTSSSSTGYSTCTTYTLVQHHQPDRSLTFTTAAPGSTSISRTGHLPVLHEPVCTSISMTDVLSVLPAHKHTSSSRICHLHVLPAPGCTCRRRTGHYLKQFFLNFGTKTAAAGHYLYLHLYLYLGAPVIAEQLLPVECTCACI